MKKLILIDNFDSFTYNLKHYLEQFAHVDVVRVDQLSLSQIEQFDGIIISPGPRLPTDYPILFEVLETYSLQKPILGVCLGMQCMAMYFQHSLENMEFVKHGVSETLDNIANDHFLYQHLHFPIEVARYHSWGIPLSSALKKDFEITSTIDHYCMSFQHKQLPLTGVQYHPESIMTPQGLKIIENWVLSL
ncbi:MAG: aminodeoxychorismate/anthranilate synthase component II [Flavobacteriales bacterium]|jgi:anthranilate synthase component 2|nr:aminodeoxychorismate/anthranilate synthase component II [Flavobacteriales bacterium]